MDHIENQMYFHLYIHVRQRSALLEVVGFQKENIVYAVQACVLDSGNFSLQS